MASSVVFLQRRFSAVSLFLIVYAITFVGVERSVVAELTKPTAKDRRVAITVSSLIKNQHLSKRSVDDEISQRAMKGFLRSLDPMKIYFYQADISEFMPRNQELDDMFNSGDISFAYIVFERFLERVDERVALVGELLEGTFDFSLTEEMTSDPKSTVYAMNAEESRNRWRQRIKYELLVLKDDDTVGDEAVERLQRRYRSFRNRMHQIDGDELLEMFLSSITASLDPHTTFMSPTNFENFQIQMRLQLDGIGAALRGTDGYTVVTKIIKGGAADRQGELQVEDRIVSVGQNSEGDMVEVLDMKLNDVVQLIRGKAGTTVRLGIKPADGSETKVITIIRAKIELEDSAARGVVFEEGKKTDGSPYKVGVIDLPSFYMDMEAARRGEKNYRSTTKDLRRIINGGVDAKGNQVDGFNQQGVDAVILDLRYNGGGSLNEAIGTTGLFIDHGPVVQVKDSGDDIHPLPDIERGMVWKGPLIVLTSKFSASASEILAGAIQDYRRGLVIGDESTHGKGTVQSLLDLGRQLFPIPKPPNLGALKITMQQFYRPNGDSTQKRGVLSDIVLPSLTNFMDVSESDLDYALEFNRVPAAAFKELDLVNNEILTTLRKRSSERRTESEDFAKLLKNIDRYRAQKEKKKVTLNEEQFFLERAELNAEKEEEKQFEEQVNDSTEEVVERNFYFNEVISIMIDYLDVLNDNTLASRS
ncbi:MAG: carboxy terminal-processing peptidase [Pirellulaceae bacterium]|nr:carboxy terminal-processing peptidase [Pirellulaceae bacterium]